jgi:hypothetical protein
MVVALRRLRQRDEFKASLGYTVSLRQAWIIYSKTPSQKTNKM